MTAPSLVLIQHVHLATTSRPSTGAAALTTAALYVAVTGAGLLAAPVFTGVGGSRRLRLPILAAGLGGYAVLLAVLGATGQISTDRMAAALALTLVAGA